MRDTVLPTNDVQCQENQMRKYNEELENNIEDVNPEVISHGNDVDKDNLGEDERIDKTERHDMLRKIILRQNLK